MNRLAALVRTALAWVVVAAPSVGEELEQVREGVHAPDPPSAPSAPRERSNDTWDDPWDDSDDSFDDAVTYLVLAVVAAPYWIPYSAFDEPGCERFAGYCEEYDHLPFKDSEWFCSSNYIVASARAQAEYGTNYGDMQSVGTRLQIDFPLLRTSIESSWTNYYEDLSSGTDHLALGDANLVFRFVQNPRTTWRSGVGLNWLNASDGDIGFNFTYGVDVLPVHPVVWSSEIDLGTLGNASLFRIRTTLGAQWLDGELYTGFEYVDIEDAQIPQMLFGFRYWW